MIRRILLSISSRIKYYYPRITNILYELWVFLCPFKKTLIIDAFMEQRFGRPCRFNWGDDINYYVFKATTNSNIIIYRSSFFSQLFHLDRYCLIGSIIGLNVDKHTIIWGSGINIGFDKSLFKKPKKVCAVRGPLTRQFLIECGVSCPEVYGDPALLLPFIYKPQNVIKHFKVGVIPHFTEKNVELIKIIGENTHDYHIIDLMNYSNWTSIIDEICECDYILSSSLHGLIVADAYGIPNRFVYFGRINTSEDFFKYRDYYLSVGRIFSEPPLLKDISQFNEIVTNRQDYQHINIDIRKLVESCPFNIKLNE